MLWPFGKKRDEADSGVKPPDQKSSDQSARADLLWKQGSRNLERRRYDRAIESMMEAFELEPTRLEGRLNLGAAYFLAGQPEAAIPHLRYVLAIDPQNTSALLNLAAAYDGAGHLEDSVAVLESLVRDRPQWADAHYNLAVAYLKLERYEAAAESLSAELRLNPGNQAARTLLNEVHLNPRRYAKKRAPLQDEVSPEDL